MEGFRDICSALSVGWSWSGFWVCCKCISSKDLCRKSLIQVLRQLGLTGKWKAASEVCGGVLAGWVNWVMLSFAWLHCFPDVADEPCSGRIQLCTARQCTTSCPFRGMLKNQESAETDDRYDRHEGYEGYEGYGWGGWGTTTAISAHPMLGFAISCEIRLDNSANTDCKWPPRRAHREVKFWQSVYKNCKGLRERKSNM